MAETDSLPKDIVGVPESERESWRRTLAGAWVATVNKMTEVLEGVCSYVFSRNALTEREKEKALRYAEDEFTPEELVFILRTIASQSRRNGFAGRVEDYLNRLGIEDDESRSAVAQDMQRAYMYLSEKGAKKLGQVYERNNKDDATVVKYRGELQGVSLDAIREVLEYNKEVQTETLLKYGFNPDVVINASALREQIAEAKLRRALEDKKTLVRNMQRTFGRAIARIGSLAAMSGVMATLMQADAPLASSADALQLENQRAGNTLVVPTPMPLLTAVPESVIDTTATAVPAAWPTETVTQEPKDSATTTSTPTEVATATAEVVQKSYYRFGNIEFGPDDGTPGKPTFLFIESTEGNFVLFFVPKQFTEEDAKNADYDSWRLRYNIAFIDGGGATVQTIHSGSSRTWFGEKLRWPAERLREYIEEGDLGPEERIKRLANSITGVRVVQAEGIVDSQGINYADPRQVEELVARVDANGGGMIKPVFEEVGSFDIVRLDPAQTTALEKAFEEAGRAGRSVSLANYFPSEPRIEIGPGDVVVMFCGQAAAGERPDPRRPNNQQTRNFLVLRRN
jgi:hypothetical protein